MLGERREPGTYMVRELATGTKAELLPVEVIMRFRDALESVSDNRNTQGDT